MANDSDTARGSEAPFLAQSGSESSSNGVGYKRPPKHSQFKKGRSGNPKGRPKGRKNLSNALEDILGETVPVTVAGRVTRMGLNEALVSSAVNRALKGNKSAMDFVLFLAEKTGRLDKTSAAGNETGIIIVPERSATHEEWEAKHGAAARGERPFNNDGRATATKGDIDLGGRRRTIRRGQFRRCLRDLSTISVALQTTAREMRNCPGTGASCRGRHPNDAHGHNVAAAWSLSRGIERGSHRRVCSAAGTLGLFRPALLADISRPQR